jgi:heat shock protein HslJ
MKKTILWLIILLVIIGGSFYGYKVYSSKVKESQKVTDYKNATYIIEGQSVKLINGVSEVEAAPGSASKIVTRYFGNELRKDLDGDGREDVVFLLTQEPGGSGTFFYVVAALNKGSGYVGSSGLLLGDRIAPQTTESGDNKMVIVNYADRAPGEPMTTRPSMAKSIWLQLDTTNMQFGEVVQNFEGEADPSKMRLDMQTWKWIKTTYTGKPEVTPKIANKFTLTFSDNSKFSATTDCNSKVGTYTVKDGALTFGDIASTQMYCKDSQENEFTSMLSNTEKYNFTSKGELILTLKNQAGSVTFR